MPRENEAEWQRAKRIIHKQYPGLSEDDDKFWKIVQHIYQNMKSMWKINLAVLAKAIEVAIIYPERITRRDVTDYYWLICSHLDDLQKAAYKLQGRMKFHDLDISIENKKGSVRKGEDEDGHEWKIKMKHPYGYIRLTEGADGEHVDCYIGENKESKNIFVIHQNDPTTHKYDEDKVMLGFVTASEAKKAYLEQYDRPGFFGSIEKFEINKFQDKVKRKKGKITGGELTKAVHVKKDYSSKEVKALGMRWVTIRGNHVLVQQVAGGGWVVVGGAGGKLSHFKIDKLMSPKEYKEQAKERQEERLKELTTEEIKEQAEKRKIEIQKKKEAKAIYETKVRDIVGISKEKFKSKITQDEMDNIRKVATEKVIKTTDKGKELPGALVEEAVRQEVEKATRREQEKRVKEMEKDATDLIANDFFGEKLDPNEKRNIEQEMDIGKAKQLLAARREFRKMIKEINKGREPSQTKLKIGETFAEDSKSITDEVIKEVEQHIETRKNIQLYEALNAQSLSIQKYIDSGSMQSLNGIIGDVYETGGVFSNKTIESLGLEACVRIVAAKMQKDGKGEIIKEGLMKYARKNNRRIVEGALKESEKRFANADEIRKMTEKPPGKDSLSMICTASANGYALKHLVKGQMALGTTVGSLRSIAHLINALEEQPGDSILVEMGKDLFRARKKAKEAGLMRGDYSIKTKDGHFIMEVPKDSWDKFFERSDHIKKTEEKIDRIKSHKENTGYKPKGMLAKCTLTEAQEAGLRFFSEQGRVILDYEAGIGKTPLAYAASMEAIHNKGVKKVLIVTPPKLRDQFYDERKKFLDEDNQKSVFLNDFPKKQRLQNYGKEGITIVGHDQFNTDREAIKAGGYEMLVVDEFHEMTTSGPSVEVGSKRYKGMMEMSDIKYKIGMSGTNIKNKKSELYKKINFIDPDHTMGSLKDFDERYKNLNQSTNAFQQSANNAFRNEVAPWLYTQKNNLPVKNSINEIKVELSGEQQRSYAKSEELYRKERDAKQKGAASRRDSRNYRIIHDGDVIPPSKNKKIDYILDTIKENHPNEKAVIHVMGLEAMRSMKRALEKEHGRGCVRTIHGDTKKEQIRNSKKLFNDMDSKVKFLVGTKSLEMGHNLQMGGTVNFHLDVPLTYASFDQRNKRTYRNGQDKDVTTYLVSSKTPFDMGREDIMGTKKKEMGIMGNPRSVEEYDEEGFLGMLNQLEKEIGTLVKAKILPEGTIRDYGRYGHYKKVGKKWKKISDKEAKGKAIEKKKVAVKKKIKKKIRFLTASEEKKLGELLFDWNEMMGEGYKLVADKLRDTIEQELKGTKYNFESFKKYFVEEKAEKKAITKKKEKQQELEFEKTIEKSVETLKKEMNCNIQLLRGNIKIPSWSILLDVKKFGSILKEIKKYIDFGKYTPYSANRKLEIILSPNLKGTKGERVGGLYYQGRSILEISTDIPSSVLHELGHYFYDVDSMLGKDFTKWEIESGYLEKVGNYFKYHGHELHGSKSDYWLKNTEMFARAFRSYIAFEGRRKGVRVIEGAREKYGYGFKEVDPTDFMFEDGKFKEMIKKSLGSELVKAIILK